MHPILSKNTYLVKEHVGMFKAANNFDVYDPETGEEILECREENLGTLTKLFRFTKYKRMPPFDIQIRTPNGEPVVRVTRGVAILFRSNVQVYDDRDEYAGGFKQHFFSLGGAFTVLGKQDQELCTLKGKWTGWEFRFMHGEIELARVTKKWAGLGQEIFTTADNYILSISAEVPADNPVRELIMAAVMCIDMVLKE